MLLRHPSIAKSLHFDAGAACLKGPNRFSLRCYKASLHQMIWRVPLRTWQLILVSFAGLRVAASLVLHDSSVKLETLASWTSLHACFDMDPSRIWSFMRTGPMRDLALLDDGATSWGRTDHLISCSIPHLRLWPSIYLWSTIKSHSTFHTFLLDQIAHIHLVRSHRRFDDSIKYLVYWRNK